jgi:hypothetical protein
MIWYKTRLRERATFDTSGFKTLHYFGRTRLELFSKRTSVVALGISREEQDGMIPMILVAGSGKERVIAKNYVTKVDCRSQKIRT